MKKNGYTVIELVIVLGVFSVVYFTTAFIISKEFKGDYKEDMYNNKIAAIEKQAEIYAEGTKDIFKESETVYFTVEELAEKNVVISTKEGLVADPRDENENLNNLKVKVTLSGDKVSAKVLG